MPGARRERGKHGREECTPSTAAKWRASCLDPRYPQPMRSHMLWNSANRPVRMQYALALCGVLVLSACASKYAQVPARLDLAPYGRIALVTFSADQANRPLSTLATQRFAEALLQSQTGVELLELGAGDSSLMDMAARGDAAGLARALGKDQDIPAVFVGQLTLSQVKPRRDT